MFEGFLDQGGLIEPQQPITLNCTYNLKYGFFYDELSRPTPYVPSFYCHILQVLTMIFCSFCYVLKTMVHTDKADRFKKLGFEFFLVVCSTVSIFLSKALPKLPLNNIFFLAFFVLYSKNLKREGRRVLKIFKGISQVILLELVFLGLTAYAVRLYTFDFADSQYDTKEFFLYNLSSYYDIFVTLMYMQTVNNFPDLIVQSSTLVGSGLYHVVIIVHQIICFFVIHSMLLGYTQEQYNKIYEEEVEHELEDKETIVIALEMIEDPTHLRFNALKDLALENLHMKEEEAIKAMKMEVIPENADEAPEPTYKSPKSLSSSNSNSHSNPLSHRITIGKRKESISKFRQEISLKRTSRSPKSKSSESSDGLFDKQSLRERFSASSRKNSVHHLGDFGKSHFKHKFKSHKEIKISDKSSDDASKQGDLSRLALEKAFKDWNVKKPEQHKEHTKHGRLEDREYARQDDGLTNDGDSTKTEEHVGEHLLAGNIYLETFDKMMGDPRKGDSYEFIFPEYKLRSHMKFHIKFLARAPDEVLAWRKKWAIWVEFALTIIVVICPVTISDFGDNHFHPFLISGISSSLLLLRVSALTNMLETPADLDREEEQ